MNCENFQELLIERIYGRLPDDREKALQDHARDCPDCAIALERSMGIQNAMDPGEEIPMPDFDASWRDIQARTVGAGRRRGGWLVRWRLALVPTAVAMIFAIGVFTGRSVFSPEPDVSGIGFPEKTSIASYTESLEPLLLDFANQRGRPVDAELAELTQKVAVDMLARTRLLKLAAAHSGDESLYVLLDDIELVLISISNLGNQNGDIAGQLERVIRSKSIVPRLKRLPAESETI